VGLKALIRTLTKLVLIAVGGVLGALAVVWAGDNSSWVTIRLPAMMVPGAGRAIEYEARLYGVVALSFSAGVLSCFWIALAIWARAVRRERRLSKVLERLEAQVKATRELHLSEEDQAPALAASNRSEKEDRFEDFEELDQDDEPELISDTSQLPEGYDEPEDEFEDPGDQREGGAVG
jgi:hypothetical protein